MCSAWRSGFMFSPPFVPGGSSFLPLSPTTRSAEGCFGQLCREKSKFFSVAHLCAPFVLIRWVAGSGEGRSAGAIKASPITTKSACLQNADRRRRIIKSIYMISVFILIVGIVRWRGYAFFSWCRSWTLRKSKKDTVRRPPLGYRVPASRHWFVQAQRNGSSEIKAAVSNGRVDRLLYDGFFLLPLHSRGN